MNFRTTAILFGIALVACVALLIVHFASDSGPPTDSLLEELTASGTKAEQIDGVVIDRTPGGTMEFVRKGKDDWEIVKPVRARADKFAVSGLISALLKAKPTASSELTSNPAMHGLEPPSLKVTLRKGDVTSTLNVGTVVLGTKGVAFVTTSARPDRPMAVSRTELDSLLRDAGKTNGGPAGDLAKWTADYRAKQVFSGDIVGASEDIRAIKLTGRGKELALSRAAEGWVFDSPAHLKGAPAETAGDPATSLNTFNGVRPLLGALTSLQAAGTADFIEPDKDLKEYGLDPAERIRVELTIKDKDGTERHEVAFIGKKVDGPPAMPTMPGMPPAPGGKVYVQVEGEAGIIRATAGNLDGLANAIADPNPLRDRNLLAIEKARIDGLDITAGGQTTKLRRVGPEWKLFGGSGDPQAAGRGQIEEILDLVSKPRTVKDFPDPKLITGPVPGQVAEIKIYSEGAEPGGTEPNAEPKLKGKPIVLVFGKQGDSTYVRRTLANNTSNDFLLPEKLDIGGQKDANALSVASRGRLDYLDTRLATFTSLQANRLTVTRGSNVVEVETTGPQPLYPEGKWTFAKPDGDKGRIADAPTIGSALAALATMNAAVRYVKEQPTDAELAGYGLDPKAPKIRVEVGLADAANPSVKAQMYEFGNDAADGLIYARQGGKSAVFLVPKLNAEKFAALDLRDRTVARFDPAQVSSVRLRGWQATIGFVTVLEFERSGAGWAAKSPPTPAGYALDPNKVNEFLTMLNGLRVKDFVAGGQKPEHGFPPEMQGLEINLTFQGAPAALINIAGPTEGGAAYFAFSTYQPAGTQEFTIASDRMKPYKERPAVFAK